MFEGPHCTVTLRVDTLCRASSARADDHQLVRQRSQPWNYKLGAVYQNLLPGPLLFLPSLLQPVSTIISLEGAAHGHEWVHWLLSLLPVPQVIMQFPVLGLVDVLYQQHIDLANGVLDAAISLVGIYFSFVLMPAMDAVLGTDLHPKSMVERKVASEDMRYRALLWTWVGLHCGLLVICADAVHGHNMHPLACLGLMLTLGAEGALGFVVSHELVHGHHKMDQWLANVMLCTTGYMHWSVSHIAHHTQVATIDDPATARLGESLYRFVPRSVAGNWKDATRLELARLHTQNQTPLSAHNRMFTWAAAPLGMLAVMASAFGAEGMTLCVGQAALSVLMLEAANYVQHYGLQRTKLDNGRYEGVKAEHSWNANWLFTNSCMFQLPLHSDHHLHGAKPYQVLQDKREAPQLPASYSVMALLAMVPIAFFTVMDPRAIKAVQMHNDLEQS
ncbi:TPA: hypothetical protein ACH3X3_001510 [Trebouxia sp. C0006]